MAFDLLYSKSKLFVFSWDKPIKGDILRRRKHNVRLYEKKCRKGIGPLKYGFCSNNYWGWCDNEHVVSQRHTVCNFPVMCQYVTLQKLYRAKRIEAHWKGGGFLINHPFFLFDV